MNRLQASLLSVLVLAAAPAWAAFDALCSVDRPCSVSLTGDTVTVVWRGAVGGFAGSTTVRSNAGLFRIDARGAQQTLGTRPVAVSAVVAASPTGGVSPFEIVETFALPQTVVEAARQAGADRILYQREFSESAGGVDRNNGRVAIPVPPVAPPTAPPGGPPPAAPPADTAPAASALRVERLQLRLEDGRPFALVAAGAHLSAVAGLRYAGSGLLDAVWEIAEPAAAEAGELAFRPLQRVRRYLGAGRDVVLQSPPLPTGQTGPYRLRLRLVQPPVDFPPPELAYQVQAAAAVRPAPQRIALLEPAEGAVLHRDTRFAWQPVPGAWAYQLELYEAGVPGAPPASGIVVPGRAAETRLSAPVLARLASGRYRWRVIAVDAEGRLVGESPLRAIERRP